MNLLPTSSVLVIRNDESFVQANNRLFAPYSKNQILECVSDFVHINAILNLIQVDVIFVDLDSSNFQVIHYLDDIQANSNIVLISKLQNFKELLNSYRNLDTIHLPSAEKKSVFAKSKAEPYVPDRQSFEWISLPTAIGFRFVHKAEIVMFSFEKKATTDRENWVAYLSNSEKIRMKSNITSKEIMHLLHVFDFVQVSQKCILNIKHLNSIEIKTRRCMLNVPFQDEEIVISRNFLNEIKERFDI